MAAAEGDDADVFGYHFENGMLAVNLFHMRAGKMVDRREFFWEDLPEFAASLETDTSVILETDTPVQSDVSVSPVSPLPSSTEIWIFGPQSRCAW